VSDEKLSRYGTIWGIDPCGEMGSVPKSSENGEFGGGSSIKINKNPQKFRD